MGLKKGTRWALKYDCCVVCKTTTRKVRGHGMCRLCYKRWKRRKDGIPPIGGWSLLHKECIDCHQTKVAHAGWGRCRSCYTRNQKKVKQEKERYQKWLETCERCPYCRKPIEKIEEAMDVLNIGNRVEFYHRPCYKLWLDNWTDKLKP